MKSLMTPLIAIRVCRPNCTNCAARLYFSGRNFVSGSLP
jgi:hypothetical protein